MQELQSSGVTLARLRLLTVAFTVLGAMTIVCAWADSMALHSAAFVPLGDKASLAVFHSTGRFLVSLTLVKQSIGVKTPVGFYRIPALAHPPGETFESFAGNYEHYPDYNHLRVVFPSWFLILLWILAGAAIFFFLRRLEARRRKKITSP